MRASACHLGPPEAPTMVAKASGSSPRSARMALARRPARIRSGDDEAGDELDDAMAGLDGAGARRVTFANPLRSGESNIP
jgi:hypothetical protein